MGRRWLHPEEDYASVDAPINETGSRLPRALLAYQVAMLDVIRKYSGAAFAPVVIDSPNRQDQDRHNLDRILRFISKHQPSDSQLIVGMVDPMGHEFGGSEVVLTRKDALLYREQFESVTSEMRRYIDAMIQ